MDNVVAGLGPAFAAGFALQRLFEIVDPGLGWVVKRFKAKDDPVTKKLVLSVIALVFGWVLAYWGGLRVLGPLGSHAPGWVDVIVTGLVISGGTEGFNSIMKFLGYAKESQAKNAVAKTTAVEGSVG